MTTAPNTEPSNESQTDDARHFLYFADPMCSWCYGFSPIIAHMREHFKDQLGVRVVVGGLRAGNTQAMREQDRDYIRNAWTRVEAASGQPFDHSFFDREHFVYDTEPACRAVVTARKIAPGRELDLKAAISRAFYSQNRDTTRGDILADIAADQGINRSDFETAFNDPETRNETARDFHFSQQSGVQGFPCLVVGRESDGYALVTNGFRPLDGLVQAVEGWLKNHPETANGSV